MSGRPFLLKAVCCSNVAEKLLCCVIFLLLWLSSTTKGNVSRKRLIMALSSRRIGVPHGGGEAWWQVEDSLRGTGSWKVISHSRHEAERELEVPEAHPYSHRSLSKAAPLQFLPKQHHSLGTKCSMPEPLGAISHSNHKQWLLGFGLLRCLTMLTSAPEGWGRTGTEKGLEGLCLLAVSLKSAGVKEDLTVLEQPSRATRVVLTKYPRVPGLWVCSIKPSSDRFTCKNAM